MKIFKEIPIEKPITPLLDSINLPSDIRSFSLGELENLANEVSPYVGKYFSVEYIRKNVLRQSDEDIIEIDNQIRNEIKQGIIAAPEGMDTDEGMETGIDNTDINIGHN